MVSWRQECPAAPWFAVSVNLSGRQFTDPHLVEDVTLILQETGMEPLRLILEITESVMMDDVSTAVVTIEGLRKLGVQLAIDDFGTGYSSLASLRYLPVNHLKIDRSFIDGLGTETDDSVIVSGIVGLAHGLRLSVVAEGVETIEQLSQLRALGCNYAQGFFFSRPLPTAGISDMLCSMVDTP